MGSSSEGDTENEEQGGCNNTGSTAQSVDQGTEEDHTEDLTDQERVGQPGLDIGGHGVGVSSQLAGAWYATLVRAGPT